MGASHPTPSHSTDPFLRDPATLPALYQQQPTLGWWLRFLALNRRSGFTETELETIRGQLCFIAEQSKISFLDRPETPDARHKNLISVTDTLRVRDVSPEPAATERAARKSTIAMMYQIEHLTAGTQKIKDAATRKMTAPKTTICPSLWAMS